MPQIKQEILDRLKNDDTLVFALAKGTNRKFATVAKWVQGIDPLNMLSSKAVVLLLKEETGLTENQILDLEQTPATV